MKYKNFVRFILIKLKKEKNIKKVSIKIKKIKIFIFIKVLNRSYIMLVVIFEILDLIKWCFYF